MLASTVFFIFSSDAGRSPFIIIIMQLHHTHLVAIWLEGLLYGLYVPLFITALYYLMFRPCSQINKTVLASILVLFMLGTMHVAGSIKIMLDAFITFADRPGGPAALFANEAEPINLFRKSVFAISVLVGDGLVIYRGFIIWSRSWWIVAGPIASMIASFVAGSVVAAELSKLKGDDDVFSPSLLIWVPLCLSLSFITNLLVTTLISLKLWKVSRSVASLRTTTRSRRTLAILTESAALYSFVNLITIILFAAKDNAQAIPANALCQIIGIAPTLVVVQVQAGLSEADRGRTNDRYESRGMTGGPSRAGPEYGGHGSESAPVVVSIGRSTFGSHVHEVPEKGSAVV